MIHLKRFKDQNGKKVKNNEIVSYPEILQLNDKVNKDNMHKYRLNSIVIHEGSL